MPTCMKNNVDSELHQWGKKQKRKKEKERFGLNGLAWYIPEKDFLYGKTDKHLFQENQTQQDADQIQHQPCHYQNHNKKLKNS